MQKGDTVQAPSDPRGRYGFPAADARGRGPGRHRPAGRGAAPATARAPATAASAPATAACQHDLPGAARRAGPLHRVRRYLRTREGVVQVALYDEATGRTYLLSGGPDTQYTASIVKADIMALWLWRYQSRPGTPRSAARHPPTAGGANTTTTARDQVAIVRTLAYRNHVLDPEAREYGLHLVESVEPAQRWGVTCGPWGTTCAAPDYATPDLDVSVALKNGWKVPDQHHPGCVPADLGRPGRRPPDRRRSARPQRPITRR